MNISNKTNYYDNFPAVTNYTPVTPSEVDDTTTSNAPKLDLSKGNNQQVWDALTNTNSHMMITGGGGNGKTALIKEYHRLTPNSVVLATTGTAAHLIGGQTLHSFFGINPGQMYEPINPKMFVKKQKIFSKIDVICIDECSLCRCDLLDVIDKRCQMLTGIPLPFGGIRMVFSFDLWQLPPIIKKTEAGSKEETSEYKVFKEMYDTRYFFGANVMQRLIATEQIKYVELNHCFRQSEDLVFAKVLNKIRKYEHEQEDLDYINANCAFKENRLINPITICTTRKNVETINEVRLAMLHSKEKVYMGESRGKTVDKPVPDSNRFKVGASVLIKINDQEKDKAGKRMNRYQNGTIAVVTKLHPNSIEVKIAGLPKPVELGMYEWVDNEYEIDTENDQVIATPVGWYKNIPAMTAFAMTVHSTQGQTLDEAIFDVPAFKEFEHGLIYVAVSRLTSCNGLALTKKLRMSHFNVNTELKDFFEDIKAIEL